MRSPYDSRACGFSSKSYSDKNTITKIKLAKINKILDKNISKNSKKKKFNLLLFIVKWYIKLFK